MNYLRAQGATEYLVLLAVVLIVALVSVALLGFFPGMASDAQVTQNKMYWQSASPIAIVESGAVRENGGASYTYPYLRLRNNGAYAIRLTGIIGADGAKATQFLGSNCNATWPANIQDYFYMGPGEEKYFATAVLHTTACDWQIRTFAGATSGNYVIGSPSTICQNLSASSPGVLQFNSFGFEYIEYIDGQQITKREMGAKPLTIKCNSDPRYG